MNGDGRSHVDQTRIMLRPIGSGLPLGFFSFGIGMLLLAGQAIGWIPPHDQRTVGQVLMAYVAPLEATAMVFAFLARDTLGATTLGLFTTSWLTLGWTSYTSAPGSKSAAIGIYLFGFATAVLLLALLSTLGKPFFTVLLTLATTRMVLSGWYQLGGAHAWETAAGACAVALAAFAMYGGAALGLEDARQRELLPLFRRGGAERAFQGYETQLERLEAEPGVRQQL